MSAATDEERMAAHRRAQQPAGGTCTDADLAGLRWCWRRGEPTADQVARVRQLLAKSPLGDLASAAIEGRDAGRAEARKGRAA